jgi:Putative Flp pilus-assembly TadE/G-like
MHPLSHLARAGEQDGAAMVMVAIALPVLILFASFAIDVGNWFVHHRHLQTQADAGALAAAGDFHYPCDDAAIEARAKEYGGAEAGGYNHQIGGTELENIEFGLNSPSSPNPAGGTPCETGIIDVTVGETDLPLFFRVAGLLGAVPLIRAHARVEIRTKGFVSGALPVAVPDSNPHSASVTFVDESAGETGKTLATQKLTRDGSAGKLAIWDNASEPLTLNVNRQRIGMRVNLGGGSSRECGQPLVECYELESNRGLVFVHGYSSEGSGAQPGPPLLRDVEFTEPETEGACIYSSFTLGGCDAGLHAVVDFGPCAEIEKVGPKLKAVVGGTTYELKQTGACEGSDSEWETSGAVIPIPAEAGPVPVKLEWAETKGKEGGGECKAGGGNKCKGSFGEVQRSYSADQGSGPIKLATLREPGGNAAYSLESCEGCTHELVATIGIEQNLAENATDVEQPPVALRVFHEAANNPSQNQALDCDPAVPNLREEIAQGCAPEYKINTGTACPSPAELWASEEPWECSAIQTGGAVNQVYQGMSKRILGTEEPKAGECTHPNEWPKFPELDYGNDPRIVPVFLTPFGSFSGSGNETVPVTNFATFYVTGWAGQGNGNSSKSICETDDEAEPGTIVGHFIKYVQSLNEGEASEEPCDPSALTPCVAVLTE